MASKAVSTTALLLTLNLLFFTLVSSSVAPPPSSCLIDTLKLGVCANLLSTPPHFVVGTTPKELCCSLIAGLGDLEAAICLCSAIKANVLVFNLNVSIFLSLLFNVCGKKVPNGFQCA